MKEETKGLYWAIILSAAAVLVINWIWPSNSRNTADEELRACGVPHPPYFCGEKGR